jgi:membrane protein YqaA with SNARE-associated domain
MIYMAVGKFVRYVTMTYALLLIPEEFWTTIGRWLGFL